jgi:DNA-binding NtrC family response regulator
LEVLLARAGAQSQLARENEELRRQLAFHGVLGNLIGSSQVMTNVFQLIRQVAPTSAAVLITGESGTGKEMVARALHEQSRRKSGPFIALNCAAIPETLIESELFGHERGAFTGAVDRRIGALESAYGGTLFLDELGEMPLAMQAKLLRVLEDFQFRRLGSRHELKADIRIIAATNRDPLKAIQAGKLREDLYYRVNVFHLELPPLRDRKEDIPLLVEAMIHSLNQKHETRVTHASPEFLAALQERNWEGNVRELRNVVERAVILAGSGPIRLPYPPAGVRQEAISTVASPSPIPAKNRTPPPSPIEQSEEVPVRVGMTIGEAERLLIEATFQHEGMNRTRTASILDISTKTLLTKLRQYHLFGEDPVEEARGQAGSE